jgi:hypothetical protein
MWIPLLDYAVKRGVSLSTLRRHIKANKVQFKVEEGRYLLFFDEVTGAMSAGPVHYQSDLAVAAFDEPVEQTVAKLQDELRNAQEEISALRMLIAVYEEQIQPESYQHA